MPTTLQKRAVDNIVVKGSNITNAMKQAGYSKETAKRTNKLTNSKGYELLTKPIIKQLERKRQQAINKLTSKRMNVSTAKDLTDIIDKLTKNIQLMGGGATENINVISGFQYIKPNEVKPNKEAQNANLSPLNKKDD